MKASEKPKLQITIDNKEDIALQEFVSSMASIDDQYQRFVTQRQKRKTRKDYKLYVNKVREGSIIIDLCENAPETLPAITPVIMEYAEFLVGTISYLAAQNDKLPKFDFLKEDFLNIKKLLEPITKLKGNNINFVVNVGSNISVNQTFSFSEANTAQNQCEKEIEKLEKSGDSLIKENVELRLYQARNSSLSKSKQGNLGIIDDITDHPKVLSFANERLRYDITRGEENPLNFTYSVDVEVKLKDGSLHLETHKDIKEYEILKLHGPIENKQLFSD